MSIPYIPVRQTVVNGSGRPYANAKLWTYRAGTLTALSTFSDAARSVPNANPVSANSAGKFPPIYLDPAYDYRMILRDSAGNTLSDDDNIPSTATISAEEVGEALYPRSQAEIDAGVSPSSYGYAWGDIRRYGADGADDSAAFAAAVAQNAAGGSPVFVPAGNWRIVTEVVLEQGVTVVGESRTRAVVQVDAATGFSYVGTVGSPDGGNIVFRSLCLKGSSVALVHLTSAGQNLFEGVKFWKSTGSLVKLEDECHRTTFRNCLFQSWKTAAIEYVGLNSLNTIDDCQFNILGGDLITPTADTSACILYEYGESLRITGANVNGDDTLGRFISLSGEVSRLTVDNCYVERITRQAIYTGASSKIIGARIEHCNFSTLDSISIDLAAGSQAHEQLFVHGIRRPETTAVHILDPGSAMDFVYWGSDLDGSADHVVGYAGVRSVMKPATGRALLNYKQRQTVGPFTQDNVSASQTNVALSGTRWIAMRDGSITGIVIASTEARTAGTLTVEVYKNTGLSGASGSGTGLTAVLDDNPTSKAATYQNPGTDTFQSGDEIYVCITTDGSWTPTTADVRVFVEVEY